MSLSIAGMGWVTPLGADLDGVWSRMMAGERAAATSVKNPETGREHLYAAIPSDLTKALGRQPRLRRASPITYYAAGAGLAALEQAGLPGDAPDFASRTAVILAVSSGSVVYTRRFYEGVCKQGAAAASPMLFPETVYNAPASHLAAILGIDGYTYTLVGDSSVSLAALKLAEQLLKSHAIDTAIVVGAEEIDWVLCEAYRDWRIAGSSGTPRLYAKPSEGALLAEGGAAMVLTRAGESRGPALATMQSIDDGISYSSRKEIAPAAKKLIANAIAAHGKPSVVVGSANGSWNDRAEAEALASCRGVPVFAPKYAFGEALGASGLWQAIAVVLALQKGDIPPIYDAGEVAPGGLVREAKRGGSLNSALVLCTGVNQQAASAWITVP